MEHLTEKELAKVISDGVNNSMFKHDDFNEAMQREHRTLQQNFTRMALKWIEHLATLDENKNADDRNKASIKTAKTLIDRFKEGETVDWAKDFLPSGYLPNI